MNSIFLICCHQSQLDPPHYSPLDWPGNFIQHLQIVIVILRDIHTKSVLVTVTHPKKVFFQGRNNPRTVVGGRRGRTHILAFLVGGVICSKSKSYDLWSHQTFPNNCVWPIPQRWCLHRVWCLWQGGGIHLVVGDELSSLRWMMVITWFQSKWILNAVPSLQRLYTTTGRHLQPPIYY